jgi:hypothetical protein
MKNYHSIMSVYKNIKKGTWEQERFLAWVTWISNSDKERKTQIVKKEFRDGLTIYDVKIIQQFFDDKWHDIGIVGANGLEGLPDNLTDIT